MGGISDLGRSVYDLYYQVSPITMTGGIAGNIPGGMLPIVATIAGLGGLAQGVISGLVQQGFGGLTIDDFPWRFVPVPGTTAINQIAATYPFANRRIAANATIEQPKSVALRMIWPVNQLLGMATKQALFSSMQKALESHNNSGGTYTVATPSMTFTDCLLLSVTDATPDGSRQKMIIWQWNFYQPLISQSSAANSLNGLMKLLSGGGVVTSPSWSGQLEGAASSFIGGVESGIGSAISQVQNFASSFI